MKKINITIIIIIFIIIIGLIFFIIDLKRVEKQELPLFCISSDSEVYADGGTRIYWGIGYKVIAYKKLKGYNKIHIGTYFMSYDENL